MDERLKPFVGEIDRLAEEVRVVEQSIRNASSGLGETIRTLNRLVRRARDLRREVLAACDLLLVTHQPEWQKTPRGRSVLEIKLAWERQEFEDRYLSVALDVNEVLARLSDLMEDSE